MVGILYGLNAGEGLSRSSEGSKVVLEITGSFRRGK